MTYLADIGECSDRGRRAHVEGPIGPGGDQWVVGDHDEGRSDAALCRREQLDDAPGVVLVERSGRLIGEDDRGTVHDGPGDGDSLALSARQLIGEPRS